MFERNKFLKYLVFFISIVLLLLSGGFYSLYKKQCGLIKYLEFISEQKSKESEKKEINSTKIVPDTNKSINWLEVQKIAKDTVIQIFVNSDKFNFLEPYRSPEQQEGAGSGFFINENGDILTNFHVVNQASSIQVQIPAFGRERFDAEIIGVCPDKDIALLKLKDESLKKAKAGLGKISYLKLGDSDLILRTQEVLALGYPLGQERLKSTLGIVSGRERAGFLQITAPLNPGNSGGPALNANGEVIGINFAGVVSAQNVGYVIPINEVKSTIKDLYKVKLLRKPILGCIFTAATDDMVKYLSNPTEGGWYIAKVFENTILEKIGVKANDMLYEINGYKLDLYGELAVPWSEDKISLLDFLNRFTVGDSIHFVIYRNGSRKDFDFKLDNSYLPAIRKIYPEYEPEVVDFEVIGGMVVMPLTLNHIGALIEQSPELAKYLRPESQHEAAIVITHILPDSQAYKARVLTPGSILELINEEKVKTLTDFRKAVLKSKKSGYLTIKTQDQMFAVLSKDSIIEDENKLSNRYFYDKSKLIEQLVNK